MSKEEWISDVASAYEDAGVNDNGLTARRMFDEAAKIAGARVEAILRSMMHDFALADHIGDAAEAIDEGLELLGLPPIPTHDDGTISCSGWLDGVPSLRDLKAVIR